jgi:hypothetical protein
MSNIGNNPKVDWLNLNPLSADPTNPEEGDIQYSDGTARLEGPWVYQNGAWEQFSTGGALSTVNTITFTPQSSDPGSPSTGMLFYSDGTTRAEGYWAYNGTGWVQVTGLKYQEFTHKTRFEVRAASTANVNLASEVEAGDSFGGVTLINGDLVLLKDQTTTTENGVYVVQLSGAPVRDASYNDATELTRAHIYVSSGTNANSVYFQNNTLATLGDAQSWATTPTSFSFTVPQDVFELDIIGCGSGGGGGGGGGSNAANNNSASGGSGGLGSALQKTNKVKVTPGDILTIDTGFGGVRGTGGAGGGGAGGTGGSGVNSVISGLTGDISEVLFPGALGGPGGPWGSVISAPTNTTYVTIPRDGTSVWLAGAGRPPNGGAASGGSALATEYTIDGNEITGASSGTSGAQAGGGLGGGGGGAGASSNFGSGGNGGRGADNATTNNAAGTDVSTFGTGGGGGGAGAEALNGAGRTGGWGADGYVKVSWE